MNLKEQLDKFMSVATDTPWAAVDYTEYTMIEGVHTDVASDASNEDAEFITALVNAYANGDLITKEEHEAAMDKQAEEFYQDMAGEDL